MDLTSHLPCGPSQPAALADWPSALATAKLPPATRIHFATEISRFLRYCAILELPATPRHARTYLARIPVPSARPLAQQALRWFFHAAPQTAASR